MDQQLFTNKMSSPFCKISPTILNRHHLQSKMAAFFQQDVLVTSNFFKFGGNFLASAFCLNYHYYELYLSRLESTLQEITSPRVSKEMLKHLHSK